MKSNLFFTRHCVILLKNTSHNIYNTHVHLIAVLLNNAMKNQKATRF